MGWWGKAIGGTLGFMLGGPLGALLGAALGHQFDRGFDVARLGWDGGVDRERTQAAFFTATFSVMGRVAKADGRVSENEIAFARSVMDRMSLDDERRRAAIRLFNEGKQPDFPLDAALDQFRRECRNRSSLIRMFLEIQLQAAYADGGRLEYTERNLLLHLFNKLGFTRRDFEHLDNLVRMGHHFTGQAYNGETGGEGAKRGAGGRQRARPTSPRTRLHEAYQVLGVSESDADAEVKKAYRRLMNQHHPDKLVAKGLPEEMVRLATEKSQEIKNAYDTIKAARGLR